MRTLSVRIVTRRILRQRIIIENLNILANFWIKSKSLEILFYGLIGGGDVCTLSESGRGEWCGETGREFLSPIRKEKIIEKEPKASYPHLAEAAGGRRASYTERVHPESSFRTWSLSQGSRYWSLNQVRLLRFTASDCRSKTRVNTWKMSNACLCTPIYSVE
jgi:hypothetical protein